MSKKIIKIYADALIEILKINDTKNILNELSELSTVINDSEDLKLILSGVFTKEEKKAVLNEILSKLNSGTITLSISNVLLDANRIDLLGELPALVQDFFDSEAGKIHAEVYGKDSVLNHQQVMPFVQYLESKIGKKLELHYSQDKSITAGFLLKASDLYLDATVNNQIKSFEKR